MPTCIVGCIPSARRLPMPTRRPVAGCSSLSGPLRPPKLSLRGARPKPSIWWPRRFGDEFLHDGDEVILTVMEHHADIVPWQLLQRRRKIKLLVVPINERGRTRTRGLQAALQRAHAVGVCGSRLQRAGHHQPGARDDCLRPCTRGAGVGRRGSGHPSPAGERAGARCRFSTPSRLIRYMVPRG